MGYARRVDRNQVEIVTNLRACGASVAVLSGVGFGVADLLVGLHGKNHMLEVKNGKKSKSQRKLTPAQERFHAEWRGKIHVVTSVDEALIAVGAISS